MPNIVTVPNQKILIIHRDMPKSDFIQISNSHWMKFNKKYGPFALQLYLYLAKNANDYKLALSQQAAENQAGIARTSFYKYIDLLIEKGYLVWNKGNVYDFYETPHEQEKQEAERPSCGELLSPWEEQKNSSDESRCSSESIKLPSRNREINNIYGTGYSTDKINKGLFLSEQEEDSFTIKTDDGYEF